MPKLVQKKFREYTVSARAAFSDQQLSSLIAAIEQPVAGEAGTLEGRGSVRFQELEGVGEVVLKEYRRGGLLRLLVRRRYLRRKMTRPEQEFEILEKARAAGVRVPEPVACLTKGHLLYRGWLVTRRIKERRNLIELSRSAEEELAGVMNRLTRQVELLIENRIFHVDLHPGNVVIEDSGDIYLLDFDKARFFSGNLRKLRQYYLCRWRRAVIKHELPELLTELMSVGLRRIDDHI